MKVSKHKLKVMVNPLKPLQNQVIVIAGASSKIGLVTARMAAQCGGKLVLAARNEEALSQLAEEIRSKGEAVRLPTSSPMSGKKKTLIIYIADVAIAEFGGFDTWVNNAGVSIFGFCREVMIPDMKRMFDTNFWGVVYGSRAAVKHFGQRMHERGTHQGWIRSGSLYVKASEHPLPRTLQLAEVGSREKKSSKT